MYEMRTVQNVVALSRRTSAFPKSGRSIALEIAKTTVRFRPQADVGVLLTRAASATICCAVPLSIFSCWDALFLYSQVDL